MFHSVTVGHKPKKKNKLNIFYFLDGSFILILTS